MQKYFFEYYKTLASGLMLLLFTITVYAQTPTHVPRDRTEPVNFFESTENIIFFVVLPLLIVVFYFLWKRDVKKRQDKQKDQS